jgi:hypothetical protein
VGQWTYDAYGNVLSADHIHPHAYTRVGHKGLIFERLDVGVADHGEQGAMTPGMFIGHPTCEFDTPRLVPFGKRVVQESVWISQPRVEEWQVWGGIDRRWTSGAATPNFDRY